MTDFHTVGPSTEIGPGTNKVVEINDREILVTNVANEYLAVDNICTCLAVAVGHDGNHDADDPHTRGGRLARLSKGSLEGDRVICPMHETVYDLRSGKPLSGMADISLNTYETRTDGTSVLVAEMPDCERHFWNDEGNENRP